MILDFANKWKPSDVLGVSFLNGSLKLHEKVAEVAKLWENYANIKFDFTGNSKNVIRIRFNAGKNDSKIGTDALTFSNEEETMSYAYIHENSSESEIKRVVLHEFGHALGLIHEHFHPHSGINFDRKKTVEHFMSVSGFSEADVDRNVLRKYCINQLSSTEFDPNSIMMYDIPSDCTTDGKEYRKPYGLSELDKKFISIVYPQQENPFDELAFNRSNEFETLNSYEEKIFRITVNPQETEKRYYVETSSSQDIALSLFRIEDEGVRKGYIDYLEPFDENNETIGIGAKIELEEYRIKQKPNINEYFLRIRLKDIIANEKVTGHVMVRAV